MLCPGIAVLKGKMQLVKTGLCVVGVHANCEVCSRVRGMHQLVSITFVMHADAPYGETALLKKKMQHFAGQQIRSIH